MKPQKPRILIVGAQHGDERLGSRLQRALCQDTAEHYATVDYICGNPRAYRQNVRFTETDLNRSYDTLPPETYEQKRAQKILQHIAKGNYNYVLDVHTSRANVGRFFLATHLGDPIKQVIAASSFERIAIMPPHIAGCSLIGQVPQAVSVEYDRHLAQTKEALQELLGLVNSLLAGTTHHMQRELFYVDDKIPLDTSISHTAKNFELCEQGFYPVIFGRDSSYTTYKGFAAHRKEQQII